MAQEDEPHDREEVFVAGKIRVGTQVISHRPKAFFNFTDVFQNVPRMLNIVTVNSFLFI